MSHYDINHFIRELEWGLPSQDEQKQKVNLVIGAMQKLLSNSQLFSPQFIDDLCNGKSSDLLYHSSEENFVVHAFVWPSGVYTPIHDHETWGVMGVYQNQLHVTEYDLNPMGEPGQYDLVERQNYPANRGAISYLLQNEDEIHHVMNKGEDLAISIHVYGKPIDDYNIFDPEAGQIRRASDS